MTSILYDGWPLLHQPLSNAALHLEAILALLPDGIQAVVAFPQVPPDTVAGRLPQGSSIEVRPQNSRRKWEQRVLPDLQAKAGIQLSHLSGETAALFGPQVAAVSPSSWFELSGMPGAAPKEKGGRLRQALAAGGTARARHLLWPRDLAQFAPGTAPRLLTPAVHPAFIPHEHFYPPQIPGLDLPETFVLYHGPQDPETLRRALEIWTWAAGPVGEVYPLLMLGLDGPARKQVEDWIPDLKLEDTVVTLPEVASEHLPLLYQACAALFHPAPVAPWGGAVRRALACLRPVVSIDHPANSALVAAAGYLVDREDIRRLGAAMIAVIIKEPLQKQLRSAAIDLVHGWSAKAFSAELAQIYQS
jgi:hypothetical protein